MLPSVIEHNREALRTIRRSAVRLPPLFATWIRRRPAIEDNWTAVLCRASPVAEEMGLWTIDLVRGPIQELRCGIVLAAELDEWLGGGVHDILVQRSSSTPEENGKYYHTTLRYWGHTIRRGDGSRVPFFSFSRPCSVLPSRYTNIVRGAASEWAGVLRAGVTFGLPTLTEMRLLAEYGAPVLPTAPVVRVEDTEEYKELETEAVYRVQEKVRLDMEVYTLKKELEAVKREKARMPQRIVNGFIEGVVAGGGVCPIELDALVAAEACLTPCGHVMSFAAAERWLQGARTCPECRAVLCLEDLQRWVG